MGLYRSIRDSIAKRFGKPGGGNSLRLLQVTDPHLHAHKASKMRGVNTWHSLLAVMDAARADGWPPDAILATGDLVQDETRAGYKLFRHLFEQLRVPVFCLPGNHDAPELMRELLTGKPFQYCGVALFNHWCIPLLDTYLKGEAGGRLSDQSLAALDETLRRQADRHALVCLHHQPVPMGSRWLDGVGLANAQAFLDVLDRHDNVRGVLWGHVHQASDRERNGVRMMSTPSTCAQFLPNSDDFALDSRPPGYRWLELRCDGSISTRVLWVEGYSDS